MIGILCEKDVNFGCKNDAFTMNPLFEAVELMTKEEVRAFKLFSARVSMQTGRKDMDLFDMMRKKGDKYDESAAFSKLYSDPSKNTFHRLKSRLLHDINRSLVDQHLEENDILKLWHFLSVVELYLSKGHHELAEWFLRKAEILAMKLDHREAMDIVLGLFIRLSHIVADLDPGLYIQRRKANLAELQRMRELDDILAAVGYRTKTSQTWGDSGGELMQMLEATVKEFSESEVTQNPALRIKMFQAVSRILLDRRDYVALETFVKQNYVQFEEERLFNRNTHEIKMQMLIYIANALYKNGKCEESLRYAELLGRAMKDFDAAFQDRYLFFYYNVLIINYYKLNIGKAIALLEEMQGNTVIMQTPFYALFVDMNMALALNQMKQYRKAIKYILQAGLQDAFHAAGPGLRLRISVAELLIRHRLNESEVLLQRLKQIQADFGSELVTKEFERERAMLQFLQLINMDGVEPRSPKVQRAAADFLAMPCTPEQRDTELIEYTEWVEELMRA
jgi:tetratricopeptide (TPR) repeat protein